MSARRKWCICPACEGEGEVDRLGVVTRGDFDDEGWEDYLAGEFMAPCTVCKGRGSVAAFDPGSLIVRPGSDGQNVHYTAATAAEVLRRQLPGSA